MTIKINNVLVNSEVLPINKPTLDETLETFSFALKSTDNGEPYAPMQSVEITTDDNEVINLLIVSDTVDIFSMNPITYKHNITCIENTRILSKHIVRNSVFSQPATLTKESFNAVNVVAGGIGGGQPSGDQDYDSTDEGYIEDSNDVYYIRNNEENYSSLNPSSIKLPLDTKEKIKKAFIRVNLFVADGKHYVSGHNDYVAKATWKNDLHSYEEFEDYYTHTTFYPYDIQLKYVLNNQTITENIDITTIPFNQDFEYPRIVELRNQGATNFELLFTNRVFIGGIYNDDNFFNGRDYFRTYVAQLKIIAETYYYTAYELLDLLLKRQQQKYSTTNKTYQKVDLFKLPVSGDLYDLLNDTIAPNFTFTQLSLYECVAEVFRLFDSIFTMSSDGTLGITYFNQANKSTKTFDFSGIDVSISEDKYTNALQSYYQEAKVKIDFPNANNYLPVRSTELGIPEEQDHYIIVPHNIHSIEKLVMKIDEIQITSNHIPTGLGYNNYVVNGTFPLDITSHVVDSSVWSTLNSNSSIPAPSNTRYQNNTIYYERFSNKIFIAYTYKNSWGITSHAFSNAIQYSVAYQFGWHYSHNNPTITDPVLSAKWYDYRFQISFIASIDGTTKTHALINKTDGETLIDQNNGAVDLNKLGLNMLGTTLKLGEPSLNATQKLTTWSNRVKIGDVIVYQGDRWIANVVAYNLLGNGYLQAKITFVKNFNALALYTKINRVRRMTNISTELTQKSEDVITNFIYFAGEENNEMPTSFQGIRQEIPFVESYLAKCLYLSFASDDSINLSIDFAVCRKYSGGIKQIFIPCVIYGAGNAINFEMSFESSISAGYKTTYGVDSTWYGGNKYFTTSVNYTDDYGFMDYCDIRLFGNSKLAFSQDFPDITSDIVNASPTPSSLIALNDYYVYKQPNEIFALNYQLAFLGLDHTKDFVGSAFINDNFFVDGFQKSRKLKLFYSSLNSRKYDVLDTKGLGTSDNIESVEYMLHTYTGATSQNYIEITFNIEHTFSQNIYSYAICDENNNILFASNRTTKIANKKISLFFIARHNRK